MLDVKTSVAADRDSSVFLLFRIAKSGTVAIQRYPLAVSPPLAVVPVASKMFHSALIGGWSQGLVADPALIICIYAGYHCIWFGMSNEFLKNVAR